VSSSRYEDQRPAWEIAIESLMRPRRAKQKFLFSPRGIFRNRKFVFHFLVHLGTHKECFLQKHSLFFIRLCYTTSVFRFLFWALIYKSVVPNIFRKVIFCVSLLLFLTQETHHGCFMQQVLYPHYFSTF